MKKIGFIDYYLDEWHANNYPAWFESICKETGKDFKLCYAWGEQANPFGGLTNSAWCEKFGVTECATIDEVIEKSDYLIVLSPDNPEKHLEYAEKVLKSGKNTYIDKTFAPDLETAEKIFALGEKYGTKFFSTSALRYADELNTYTDKVNCVTTTGGGRSLDIYVIHQLEMIVKLLGVGAKEVMTFKNGLTTTCHIKYADGRSAVINMMVGGIPFAVYAEQNSTDSVVFSEIKSPFFLRLLKAMLDFFESGIPPFDSMETLEVIAIREALIKSSEKLENWVKINEYKKA